MEKLLLREPIERCSSETEVWNTWVDPVLNSLLSSIEETVHLRWINQKDCREEPERPDGTVSIMIQSQWQRKLGYGEVKISEATETYCVLAWDLCRLSCFSRNAINKDGCKSSFAFQSKAFYTTELAFHGMYVMAELINIQIPKSVNTLETLVTRRSLMCLTQVARVFDKIKRERKITTDEFESMKRLETSIRELQVLD
ncbi:hypothetical protein RMCBS344292_12716 [Rhizopus microsporus]|nr:hypothetical protein RMCBS344292_12716 [Rhizopus microsporus]